MRGAGRRERRGGEEARKGVEHRAKVNGKERSRMESERKGCICVCWWKFLLWCLQSATFTVGWKESGLYTHTTLPSKRRREGAMRREQRERGDDEEWKWQWVLEGWQKPEERSLHACDSSWNPIHCRKGRWHCTVRKAQRNEVSGGGAIKMTERINELSVCVCESQTERSGKTHRYFVLVRVEDQ